MNTKKITIINIFTSLLAQLVTIAYGFVIPELVLSCFGSEVNGLINSSSQFLNYINLVEGGVTGVIMAALYKPLVEKDYKKISAIINASRKFYTRIAAIFSLYSLLIGIIYPIIVKTSFSWPYIFSLILIVSIENFLQYCFSASLKCLLKADKRSYVVSIAQIVFKVLNLILAIVVVKFYPNMHLLKAAGVLAFAAQPILFNIYVNKHYPIDKNEPADACALKQRWAGFGQNIAYFIHCNTDVTVLTFFAGLKYVSVYSIYNLIASSLKNLVMSISAAIAPTMGNVLVESDMSAKNRAFEIYEFGISIISTFLFTCGYLLATPFVDIYTRRVTDANYHQPIFGILLIVSELIYCLRDPYISVAYASGRFKQTSIFAYVEAILNISLSVILVKGYGLIGVAIGTCIAMIFRMVAHVLYLRKHILYRTLVLWIRNVIVFVASSVISAAIYYKFIYRVTTDYYEWVINAILTSIDVAACIIVCVCLFHRKRMMMFMNYLLPSRTQKRQ